MMVGATFIDFDEQTIPDLITVPGTIFGLAVSCFSLMWFLPVPHPAPPPVLAPALFCIPWFPPAPKWSGSYGLWCGLGIWTTWCFALADRRLILRRGLAKAVQFFFAGLVRHWTWKLLVGIWIAGVIGVIVVHQMGANAWAGLLTSLFGLAVGGGVVWAIRIVGSTAMGREAMGFGDVTLMAMIGAYVGWQCALLGFFLAPFASIAIVIVQFIVTREPQIPFGPYLCAGTILAVAFWDRLFNNWLAANIVMIGPAVVQMGLIIFVAMFVMLFVWRIIKERVIYRD